MEKDKIGGIWTPKPLNRLSQILAWIKLLQRYPFSIFQDGGRPPSWICRRYDPASQNSNRSPQWGRPGKWVKYQSHMVFSFYCDLSFCSRPETKPETRFLRCLIYKMSVPGYCIPREIKLLKVFNFPKFYPKKHPQNGREYAFSSLTLKILKLAYYRNYCTDSNQILHSDRDHQSTLHGWMDGGRPPSWKIENGYLRSNSIDLPIWPIMCRVGR